MSAPLTSRDVAELYHVHLVTVDRWLRDGLLPGASKPGHDWQIPEAALEDFTPPARGPRPAADRRRLGEFAAGMVEDYPGLLDGSGTFYDEFDTLAHELARQAGVNRERARAALAKAIGIARGKARKENNDDVGDNDWGEAMASARLIAAAPDLLAACKAFVEAWEKCLQLEKTDVALQMAHAAIEKAK